MTAWESATVPSTADDVTPEWLTEVLRGSGALSERRRIRDLGRTRVGNGLVCGSIRYELRYDGTAAAAPSSVVCKFPSRNPRYRAAAVGELVYSRELGFYRDLAPSLEVPSPHCLHISVNERTGDFVLVLENLAPASRASASRWARAA